MGTTRDLWGSFKRADASSVPPGNIELVEGRLNDWRRLHGETGCTCRGRNWSGVRRSLEALEKAGGPGRRLLDIYGMASAVLHTQYPEHFIRGAELPGATYEERSRYLLWLVSIYGLGLAWFMHVENPAVTAQFTAIGNALEKNPILRRGLSGQLDAEARGRHG